MGNVHYEEVQSRSALNRVEGMGFRWSLNPYRGCVHGCHYCFARRYHAFFELSAGSDFSSVVFVKANLPEVLRQELRRPGWTRETVAVGTATDPYQPIEGRYRITRRCLEAFADVQSPVSLVTKGTLVARDRDVLQTLSGRAGCSVCISLTTLRADLWRALEPGTAPPMKRLWALEQLSARGIRAGVLLAPVLPRLTDDPADLEALVRAAADHGARFLGTQILYLKPGTKEHFLGFLREQYPGLLAEYERLYPGAYIAKRFQARIRESVAEFKAQHGLRDEPEPPAPMRQLALAL